MRWAAARSCGAINEVGALVVYRSGPGDVSPLSKLYDGPGRGNSRPPTVPRVYFSALRWLQPSS